MITTQGIWSSGAILYFLKSELINLNPSEHSGKQSVSLILIFILLLKQEGVRFKVLKIKIEKIVDCFGTGFGAVMAVNIGCFAPNMVVSAFRGFAYLDHSLCFSLRPITSEYN